MDFHLENRQVPPTAAKSTTPGSNGRPTTAKAATRAKPSAASTPTVAVQAQSSSISTSTSPKAMSSLVSSMSTSAASATSSHTTSKGSDKGLIAGVAVLAVLLAIALAAIGFLFSRRKRRTPKHSQYEPSYEQKTPLDPASAVGLENMESDLRSRDNKIRELQAALLKQGRGVSEIDERQIRNRFTVLSQNINDWVMTYYKGQDFNNPSSPRTAGLLRRIAPGYDRLLQDPRMKYLVIRGIVMESIAEAFLASEFIGSIPYNELKQGFGKSATSEKLGEWRATTVALLETMPDFGREKATASQSVTARIELMISEIAGGLRPSSAQTKNLQTIVDTAGDLSIELNKQQVTYVMDSNQAGLSFESNTMEDVSQVQSGKGRTVQAVVFPALRKVSQSGHPGTVISKAQVVI